MLPKINIATNIDVVLISVTPLKCKYKVLSKIIKHTKNAKKPNIKANLKGKFEKGIIEISKN